MGRLKALTILLMLGAGGGATEGAPLDDAAAAVDTGRRAPLPKPAADYLKAAAYLQQTGKNDLAAKYLQVAQDYRDELTTAEQTVLDQYRKAMTPAPTAPHFEAVPGPDPASPEAMVPRTWDRGRPTAPKTVARSAPSAPAPAATLAPAPASEQPQVMTLNGRSGTVDAKQRARWALATAVEAMRRNQFDEATAKVAEARAYNVKWSLFEDTPDKVSKAIDKARSKAGPTALASAGHSKKAAQDRLKQARELLKSQHYDQAEALAREVDGWNLGYSIWEDKPTNIIAAAQSLRRRDGIRKSGPLNRPSTDAYDSLIGEARQLLAAGRIDEAEAKAAQAQKLGVVPNVTADRAEAVLRAIEVVRSQARATAPGVTPDGGTALAAHEPAPALMESPASILEREADRLLSRSDPATAAAKYTEAERLRAQEAGTGDELQPLISTPPTLPAVDPMPAPPGYAATMPDAAPSGMPGAATSPGEQFLGQARALFEAGNFQAARELADRARQGGYGVETAADEMLNQINTKQQAAALALYEEALGAVRNQEYEHARVLLNEVANSGALDEGLQQRVQDLMLKIGSGQQAHRGPVDTQADADAVAAQKLNAEIAVKLGEVRRMMEVDPDKGIAILRETLTAVNAAEVPDAAKRTLARRLEVALELAQKDKAAFDQKVQDKNTREEIEKKKLRILEASKAKQARVQEYMTKAQAAMAEGKYDEAEELSLRAQEVDPMDVAATALAWKARAERGYKRDVEIRRRKEDGFVAAMQGVSEAGIVDVAAYKNGLSMPRDFKELSELRRQANERLEPKADPDRLAVERKLNESITLDMDKQPLSEVVAFLQNATGLNVVLDPKAMLETGLNETTPVSMRLKDVKLKTALKLMLQPLGLTYQPDEGVLLITSPQANVKLVERVYPVGDLVLPLSRRKKAEGASSGIPGMPTLPNIPGMPEMNAANPAGVPTSAAPVPMKSDGEFDQNNLDFTPLIQLITVTVAPNTWRVYDAKGGMMSAPEGSAMQALGLGAGFGGGAGLGGAEPESLPPGSIIPYLLNISLIIRHTPEVHEDIVNLLKQLRKLQDLQVSVEVRFITVNDSFFERIGVDFDFAIQAETYGKKASWTSLNPAAVPIVPGASAVPVGPYLVREDLSRATLGPRLPVVVGANGAGDNGIPRLSQDLSIPFLQDSYSITNPFNAISGAGATLGLAFLSDLDVYFFLNAAQGDTRSNIVQAPKVTTFNGATASVSNFRGVNYVGQLIPIVNFGAVAFQPIPQTIPDGVFLTVLPVVSADRRYVRLTLSPFFNTIDGFDTFPVPAAVGGGGIGGGSAAITGQIQLPRFSTTTVDTTVTVPDGGTVLLGGVKRLREERQEFGVPILAKTPLINRLFRNVGIGRDTDSLMLMVTPRIIILEEEEERLGIPATTPAP